MQKRVALLVDQERSLKSEIKKSITKLQNYKTSLITEAVTGQLDIEAWKNRNTADRRLDKIEEEMAS